MLVLVSDTCSYITELCVLCYYDSTAVLSRTGPRCSWEKGVDTGNSRSLCWAGLT
jgi:hypothetical protein